VAPCASGELLTNKKETQMSKFRELFEIIDWLADHEIDVRVFVDGSGYLITLRTFEDDKDLGFEELKVNSDDELLCTIRGMKMLMKKTL
jgi:hypothetical protein